MPSASSLVVVLGTGGTIAGEAGHSADATGYRAAQRTAQSLVDAVPPLAAFALEVEQVAQVDSKDMTLALMATLARRVEQHGARAEVGGIVVTHGTDTLEETAYLLHRVLATRKPVVLTAAMRPATSLQADGPQNLLDAVTVAAEPGAGGVVAVLAGRVLAGAELRKVHGYRIDAFSCGDAGPVALVEEGRLRLLRPWPVAGGWGVARLPVDDAGWPWVEIVASHAGARPDAVASLRRAGVRGLVVAATGNGTVHAALEPVLRQAVQQGVPVLRSTRCVLGGIVEGGNADAELPAAAQSSPAQARIELMLRLLGGPASGGAQPMR